MSLDINFMTVLGMFVRVILCICLCKCTVLNTFSISSAITIVRLGVFFFLLKPIVIVVFIVCKAVMMEYVVLNAYRLHAFKNILKVVCDEVKYCVLAIGDAMATGLYDVPFCWVWGWE